MSTPLTPPKSPSLSSSETTVEMSRPAIFTQTQLDHINLYLADQSPQRILEWAIMTLPDLYQTTAFGLTGLATLDMISKISSKMGKPHLVPLIFIDTLFHFKETLDLAHTASSKYNAPMHVYRPQFTDTPEEFNAAHGPRLWERDEEQYDYVVKVEPARRAYAELSVGAVLTGRRRSQGADRASIPVVEVDETGLVKVNPLAHWSYTQVLDYIKENNVPYNALLDQGYKSIGDWHSTRPAGSDAEGERSGRWQGKDKSECGLHKDYFAMKAKYMARVKEQGARKSQAGQPDDARPIKIHKVLGPAPMHVD